jgi:hypothetical protein
LGAAGDRGIAAVRLSHPKACNGIDGKAAGAVQRASHREID